MQSVSSRIWTRVAVSIPYDYNHYTTGTSYECGVYNSKQYDGEAPTLEIWGVRSTPSLLLLPGPLCPGVVAPDRVLSMAQIELFDI